MFLHLRTQGAVKEPERVDCLERPGSAFRGTAEERKGPGAREQGRFWKREEEGGRARAYRGGRGETQVPRVGECGRRTGVWSDFNFKGETRPLFLLLL